MADSDPFIIIGASHAGVQLAASLKEGGYEQEIILISDEKHLPYHRPPLSKAYLKDEDLAVQILRAEAFYSGNIRLMKNSRVRSVDCAGQRVELENGDRLQFSKLCFATGARPRALDIPGIDAKGVYEIRNSDDADLLRDDARKYESAVIVGGGFIGLEAAATLHGLGVAVSVVEASSRLMGRAVAPEISAHVLEKFRDLGIRVFLNSPISKINVDGGIVCGVECGETNIATRMVLMGIGVTPNDELARAAGIVTGNGIHVDGQMRTSSTNIYAIGDVANYEHWLVGERIRVESVQNATDQAKCLARIIMGGREEYNSVAWFWSEQADMKLQMVGLSHNSAKTVIRHNHEREAMTAFHFDALDKLIAIDTINAPADHMAGRRIIERAIAISPKQAADEGLSLRELMKQ